MLDRHFCHDDLLRELDTDLALVPSRRIKFRGEKANELLCEEG